MVLAVYCNPFFGLDTCRDPEQEPEDKSDWFRHRQGPMTQGAVEIHRGAHVCHLSNNHANDEGKQDGLNNCHDCIVTHYLLVGRQSDVELVRLGRAR